MAKRNLPDNYFKSPNVTTRVLLPRWLFFYLTPLLRSLDVEHNLNLTREQQRSLGTSIIQKKIRFVERQIRYRIRKYVIDLGRTANDLAFASEGARVVKKLVSNK